MRLFESLQTLLAILGIAGCDVYRPEFIREDGGAELDDGFVRDQGGPRDAAPTTRASTVDSTSQWTCARRLSVRGRATPISVSISMTSPPRPSTNGAQTEAW